MSKVEQDDDDGSEDSKNNEMLEIDAEGEQENDHGAPVFIVHQQPQVGALINDGNLVQEDPLQESLDQELDNIESEHDDASDYSELSYDPDDLEEQEPNKVHILDIGVANNQEQARNLFNNRRRLNFAGK